MLTIQSHSDHQACTRILLVGAQFTLPFIEEIWGVFSIKILIPNCYFGNSIALSTVYSLRNYKLTLIVWPRNFTELDDEDGSSGVDQDAFNAFVCESIRYDLDGIIIGLIECGIPYH